MVKPAEKCSFCSKKHKTPEIINACKAKKARIAYNSRTENSVQQIEKKDKTKPIKKQQPMQPIRPADNQFGLIDENIRYFQRICDQAQKKQKYYDWRRRFMVKQAFSITDNPILHIQTELLKLRQQNRLIYEVGLMDDYYWTQGLFIWAVWFFKKNHYIKIPDSQPSQWDVKTAKHLLQMCYGYSQQLIQQMVNLYNERKKQLKSLSIDELPFPDLLRQTRNSLQKKTHIDAKQAYNYVSNISDVQHNDVERVLHTQAMKIHNQIQNAIKYGKMPFFKTTIPQKLLSERMKTKRFGFKPAINICQRRLQFLLFFNGYTSLCLSKEARYLINMDALQVEQTNARPIQRIIIKNFLRLQKIRRSNQIMTKKWIQQLFKQYIPKHNTQWLTQQQLNYQYKRELLQKKQLAQENLQLGCKIDLQKQQQSQQQQQQSQQSYQSQSDSEQIGPLQKIQHGIAIFEKLSNFDNIIQQIYRDFNQECSKNIKHQRENWKILKTQIQKTKGKLQFSYCQLVNQVNLSKGYHMNGMNGVSPRNYDWSDPNLQKLIQFPNKKRISYQQKLAKIENTSDKVMSMLWKQGKYRNECMYPQQDPTPAIILSKNSKLQPFEGSNEQNLMIQYQQRKRKQYQQWKKRKQMEKQNEQFEKQTIGTLKSHANEINIDYLSNYIYHPQMESNNTVANQTMESDNTVANQKTHFGLQQKQSLQEKLEADLLRKQLQQREKIKKINELYHKMQQQMREKPICIQFLKENPNASYSQLVQVYETSKKPTQEQLRVMRAKSEKFEKNYLQKQWQLYKKHYPNINREKWFRQQARRMNLDTPIEKLLEYEDINFESLLDY